MKVTIPRGIHDQMIRHCLDGLPNEACGFLAGEGGTVTDIHLLDNAAASPVYYRPDDKQMLKAMNEIDDRGMELTAIFHSHVASEAQPSVTDIREAHYPDSFYLIVSLTDREQPQARAFRIVKEDWRDETGRVDEIDVVLS